MHIDGQQIKIIGTHLLHHFLYNVETVNWFNISICITCIRNPSLKFKKEEDAIDWHKHVKRIEKNQI